MEEDVQEDDNLEKLLKLLQAADSRLNEDSPPPLPLQLKLGLVNLCNGQTVWLLPCGRMTSCSRTGKNIMDVSSRILSNVDFLSSHVRRLEFEQ